MFINVFCLICICFWEVAETTNRVTHTSNHSLNLPPPRAPHYYCVQGKAISYLASGNNMLKNTARLSKLLTCHNSFGFCRKRRLVLPTAGTGRGGLALIYCRNNHNTGSLSGS